MSEKLLSERDAYELADILNAKGIDKFAEMAENIAHAVGKVEGWNDALKKVWKEAQLNSAQKELLRLFRKPEGGG